MWMACSTLAADRGLGCCYPADCVPVAELLDFDQPSDISGRSGPGLRAPTEQATRRLARARFGPSPDGLLIYRATRLLQPHPRSPPHLSRCCQGGPHATGSFAPTSHRQLSQSDCRSYFQLFRRTDKPHATQQVSMAAASCTGSSVGASNWGRRRLPGVGPTQLHLVHSD